MDYLIEILPSLLNGALITLEVFYPCISFIYSSRYNYSIYNAF